MARGSVKATPTAAAGQRERLTFARQSRDLAPRNRQWRLARRPLDGEPVSSANFSFGDEPIPVTGPGQVLVRTLLLGTSPAQRAYTTSGVSMHAKLQIGDVMRGRGLGVVVESRVPEFAPGDLVNASLGWQDYALLSPAPEVSGTIFDFYRVEDPQVPLSVHLGILGTAGLTGYFGLQRIGELKAGQRVVVSAAAGGVGSAAGQIAKALGAEVIGIAGSEDKCRWLREYVGYDATINYRTESVADRLKALAPEGVNVFFDNVGGEILDTVLQNLAMRARIVICGFIATDYAPGPRRGPGHYTKLLPKRARMEGFFVQDYVEEFAAAGRQLRAWRASGELRPVEEVVPGLETMPDSLGSLFAGTNRGVRLCEVAALPAPLAMADAPGSR